MEAARQQAAARGDAQTTVTEAQVFPAELRRRFEVRLLPVHDMAVRSLREVRARDIGHLLRVKAMVIRASDVKPLAKVITYTCDECGYEIYQDVTSKQFMPLGKCPSPECLENKVDGSLHMQTRGSKFVRYQELRVQELPDQVPVGHIPRTVSVVARGQLARQLQPGDVVTMAVVYTPTPYTGYRAIRAGLIGEPCSCAVARPSMRFASCTRLRSVW
jgi:DNA replication licensing factor MCM7